MIRSSNLLVVGAFAAAAVACGDDQEANTGQPGAVQCPPGQFFDGQYCQIASPNPPATGAPGQPQTGYPAGTAAPAPTTAPTTAPPPVNPPVATASAGPTATAVDPTMAAAATPLLQQLAAQHLPAGAKPLGSPVTGQFTQGQSLEQQIQMQPGKCYTVVAAAAPPVANVDIQLVPVTPIPGMQPVLAQDKETGTTATIGAKPDCFKWAFPAPAPMKLIVTVSQGQGLAAAQVYEK